MHSSLSGQAPSVVHVVIAVDGVIKQGNPFDDELAVVGETAADVPRMVLAEKIPFDVERDVHRFKDDTFSPVFPQGNLGNIAVAETELEVPVGVSPTQVEQSVELL